MSNCLVIIGAGGHGRLVEDIAVKMDRYPDIAFLNDNVIGIGNTKKRAYIANNYNLPYIGLINPSAQIGLCVSKRFTWR